MAARVHVRLGLMGARAGQLLASWAARAGRQRYHALLAASSGSIAAALFPWQGACGTLCEPAPSTSSARSVCGVWVQDQAQRESLCPFIGGLGMPAAPFVCRLVDRVTITLRISVEPSPDGPVLQVVDKSIFGRNVTRAVLGGAEAEQATRGGRKKYMLSAWRGEHDAVFIRCRLFQRGPGWETLMERRVQPDGSLVEINTLRSPGEDDVVVRRYFVRTPEVLS